MSTFNAGDRIIYSGEWIGTLVKLATHEESGTTEAHWHVHWEDGLQTSHVYDEADMKRANGESK